MAEDVRFKRGEKEVITGDNKVAVLDGCIYFTTDNDKTTEMFVDMNGKRKQVVGGNGGGEGGTIIVDQNYDPTSENAQSGKAVAEAIDGLEENLFFPLHMQKLDSSCPRYHFWMDPKIGKIYDNTSDDRVVIFPVESNKKYVVKKSTKTCMRVGTLKNEVPTNGDKCTTFVYHDTPSDGALEIQTGALDKYLYVELFISTDNANLKNVDVHLSSLVVFEPMVTETIFEEFEGAVEKVQELETNIYGEPVPFDEEGGFYYFGTTPVIGESISKMAHSAATTKLTGTRISLPKNSALRIYGMGEYTTLTRTYFVFDAETEKIIDVSGTERPLAIKPIYLSYNVDTIIYINMDKNYDYYCSIIDNYLSPFKEIMDIQNSGENATDIITLNDNKYTTHALDSLNRGKYRSTGGIKNPFVLLHFSDIHGDAENLQRIMDFKKTYSSYLSGLICTGDFVNIALEDGMDWWDNVDGANQIMLAIGNHECAKWNGNSVETYGAATPQEIYEALLKDRINNWGVIQPNNVASEYFGYYYKDYSNGIRLIVLDINHDTAYINQQVTWLQEVLLDAYTNGLSVICASHYPFRYTSNFDCSFSQILKEGELNRWEEEGNKGGDGAGWKIKPAFTTAVDDFINYGGEFVCWLGGHTHQDNIGVSTNNKNQICVTVSCASCDTVKVKYSDDLRKRGTKSQDLFNIISVDTVSKTLSILRIGSDLSRLMQERKTLCIDYENKRVIPNDSDFNGAIDQITASMDNFIDKENIDSTIPDEPNEDTIPSTLAVKNYVDSKSGGGGTTNLPDFFPSLVVKPADDAEQYITITHNKIEFSPTGNYIEFDMMGQVIVNGNLTLPYEPYLDNHAVTKKYVDDAIGTALEGDY